MTKTTRADVVIVGATPAGICAAISAARMGLNVTLMERSGHIGGLPANGLGATDISTKGATGGLFLEFVRRVRSHYVTRYGEDSKQVRHCANGYHFEPSVAEQILAAMLAEYPSITVLTRRQFDSDPANVLMDGSLIRAIRVTDRDSGGIETFEARQFIDATYEGDLAAASGVPFRVGREGFDELKEPLAGRVYIAWFGPPGSGAIVEVQPNGKTEFSAKKPAPGSTFQGDNAIQAYNFRLCLTDDPEERVEIQRPDTYRREEYASLADDVQCGYVKAFLHWGFWCDPAVVNPTRLPNRKTDSNNHHSALLSTDLPEENWPWPTSGWDWRDGFAQRLRDYTLGLIWFCQNDNALPEAFRADARKWGLSKSEYADNGHFPRQVYVREGRRIEGDHFFTAHDAIPAAPDARPPLHRDSVTASHYAIDSHAVRKREPGKPALDGFMTWKTAPYNVPFGTIVPRKVENLLVPVAVSASHLGFGTLRMEPCWMALGEAAGTAAALCFRAQVEPRKLPIRTLQRELLNRKGILIYYRDLPPDHPYGASIQLLGLQGLIPDWNARPDDPAEPEQVAQWIERLALPANPVDLDETTTRGEALHQLAEAWFECPP